ncbi:MAG: greA [Chlamydiales bacterium]|jgi:transcription elongation factor GreA-like protein/transcription elongation GreA/GreB family factor|nr:greA [Chlamydiales bacterium]
MSYLEEFQLHISQHRYPKLMPLWEEYCANDQVDSKELLRILQIIRGSEFAEPFGKKVELTLPLWQTITEANIKGEILKYILDLQTTNSKHLADIAYDYLKEKYSTDKYFNDKIRLVGLKQKESFQGAIRNYELLTHLNVGKFVYHNGGWGTGEIVDLSLVREQIIVEFENLSGRKEVAFEHAFKTLIPLSDIHFLVRRFGDPEALELEARKDGPAIIKMLLQDLGPKTAAEIKDEICEVVIPEKDWSKWWQLTRAKLKKDNRIETPESIRQPFRLRFEEQSHETRLVNKLKDVESLDQFIQEGYNLIYDFPELTKQVDLRNSFLSLITNKLSTPNLSEIQTVQLLILQDDVAGNKNSEIDKIVMQHTALDKLIQDVEITAFKKKLLTTARSRRTDWDKLFLNLLFLLPHHSLRDYIFKELSQVSTLNQLKERLNTLLNNPTDYPTAFVWYFQKVMAPQPVPLQDNEHVAHFFESFLILLHNVESQAKYRELTRKIYTILSANRYAIVRNIIEKSSYSQVEEFLLLATKCETLSDHDIKILYSLAEVVYPALAKKKKKQEAEGEETLIWTTEEGYQKIKERLNQIATVETVDNAKEIEAARALGDLRENSEFKFALERRSRLQAEMATLGKQLGQARILTREDINTDTVGVGSVVSLTDAQGQTTRYTLLGPWDANPDKNILSVQSKFAQAMLGLHEGESFHFQNENYVVKQIKSYLNEPSEATI